MNGFESMMHGCIFRCISQNIQSDKCSCFLDLEVHVSFGQVSFHQFKFKFYRSVNQLSTYFVTYHIINKDDEQLSITR